MSKTKFLDEIKSIIAQSKDWATLELEYAKLTAAEKITVLCGAAVAGAVCLLLGICALILFGISLAYAFELFLSPALAFLASGGVMLVLMALVYFFKKELIMNPIAKMLTKVLLK
ncbi:MAG: phage holin family protein [Muribaculaceae bacterium]|nr:phage holin family protein [Muribaculaceae bacterium]